jgi:hypothetical protein
MAISSAFADDDAIDGLGRRDAQTFVYFLIMRSGIRIGGFVPANYLRQVVENSDFRKYDDGLRMILDCTAELADTLDRNLAGAAGIALYGLHRQEAAMMTCFAPSPARSDHVHFIDGAQGGYAAAATALKLGIKNWLSGIRLDP